MIKDPWLFAAALVSATIGGPLLVVSLWSGNGVGIFIAVLALLLTFDLMERSVVAAGTEDKTKDKDTGRKTGSDSAEEKRHTG